MASRKDFHDHGPVLNVPVNDIVVRRRSAYDILLQLKAEADADVNHNIQLISALEENDRESGVYEGGLKTWEGALDLASLVKEVDFSGEEGGWHILELGAGSGIPSMVALAQILVRAEQADALQPRSRFHFTLSDYNDEILRLSTWANVLLASRQTLENRQTSYSSDDTESVEVNEVLISDSHKLWQKASISFKFISGPWGKDFEGATASPLLEEHRNLLILASETIYDLKSLPMFTETVINLLRQHGRSARAWIAAKKLYFGVGGGVDAFLEEVQKRGGDVREIMHIAQGVSRVVLEVTVPVEHA